ncbi:MAG: hypothetical protein IPM77_15140 [Crocinitomicaceae bacterium]|nr:hypothetical protein [Crocinitomicaceae bacterium]
MTNSTGGSFQDDFGVVWVANGAGFTKFYGDHVEQVKGDYFVFEFGPMNGLRKVSDEYYWQGGRIIDNMIFRHLSLDSQAPWIAKLDTAGLGGGIQILDEEGFYWSTYENQVTKQYHFIRYNSKDTIDMGSILKQLGIEFNSYTKHLTMDSPWNYSLLPFPPCLYIFDNLRGIWIRSKSGGIHTYNIKTGRLISLEIDLQNIAAITIDEDKNYWFTIFPYDNPNPGIYRFDGKDLINYESVGQTKIISTPDGNIWFADEQGIQKFDGKKFNLICNASSITDIVSNSRSEIIVRQNLNTNKYVVSNLKDSKLNKIIESPSYIFPIIVDHENNLWISTASDGLFKCSRTYFMYHDQTKKISGNIDRSNLNFKLRTKNNLKYYSGYDAGLFVEVDDSLRIVPVEFDGYPIVTPDSVGNLYWFNNYVYNDGNYKLEGICKLDTNLLISQPFKDVLSNFGQDIEYIDNKPLIVKDKIWILTKTSIIVLSHDDIREVQLIDTSMYTTYELQNSNHKDLKSIRLYPKSEETTKDWKFDVKLFNYHTFEYVNFESLIDSMPVSGELYSMASGKNLMTTKEYICVFDESSAQYYKKASFKNK